MTSSKPYLIRALYEWLLDNDVTPYLLVDVTVNGVDVPAGISNDGKVVLNLKPQAIDDLHISNELISFSARFNGVSNQVFCPINSILAIYAKENGEGMMFEAEEGEAVDSTALEEDSKTDREKNKSRPPGLRIVK